MSTPRESTDQGPSTGDLAGRGRAGSVDATSNAGAPTSPYPEHERRADPEAAQPPAPTAHPVDDQRAQTQQPTPTQQPDQTQQPAPQSDAALLDDAAAGSFLQRWSEVQSRFVDDPRAAVQEADSLVAQVMQTIAERFSDHKSGLEEQWNRGGEPDTEHLRRALQQYRSFFHRLLST